MQPEFSSTHLPRMLITLQGTLLQVPTKASPTKFVSIGSLTSYTAFDSVLSGFSPTTLPTSPTLSQSFAPQCPHLNAVFFHSSSFIYAFTNQDTVSSHSCKFSGHSPVLILCQTISGILDQKHSCRLQSVVCVRQPQPPWQLRALSVLVCQCVWVMSPEKPT